MSATESLRRPKLNLLVTGCTGRVGVAACADLLAAGHCVVGIDVREPESNADYDFRLCDLNQEGALHPHLQNIDAGVQHVVVASSINAIGYLFGTSSFETDYLPIDEAHPKTTTDTYSFSKQVTEDIGAYLARREGITNACLHFRAGLATLPELRQRIGSELRDTRTLWKNSPHKMPKARAPNSIVCRQPITRLAMIVCMKAGPEVLCHLPNCAS